MRKLIVLAAITAVAAVFAVPALAATKRVTVGDNFFQSGSKKNGTLTIKKGDKVRWRWTGNFPHTVTKQSGPGGSFDSGRKQGSGTYTKTFTRTGTYKIICTIHVAQGQRMTIRVRS